MTQKEIFVRAFRMFFAPLVGAVRGAIEAVRAEMERTGRADAPK